MRIFSYSSLHSISSLYYNFEEMAPHTHTHIYTLVLARARVGPRACIYVYLLEERPLDDAWAARTRSILFAAQFSRIDISSGVSRRSTTMSSNSTVVNVSKSYSREGWARGKTAGSFPLSTSILFAFSSPLSSMTFLPASHLLSSCSSSSLFVIFFRSRSLRVLKSLSSYKRKLLCIFFFYKY